MHGRPGGGSTLSHAHAQRPVGRERRAKQTAGGKGRARSGRPGGGGLQSASPSLPPPDPAARPHRQTDEQRAGEAVLARTAMPPAAKVRQPVESRAHLTGRRRQGRPADAPPRTRCHFPENSWDLLSPQPPTDGFLYTHQHVLLAQRHSKQELSCRLNFWRFGILSQCITVNNQSSKLTNLGWDTRQLHNLPMY